MSTVVRMPEVLTGMTEAVLLAWHVSTGDEVVIGQPLAEVETEKAVVEYQAEVTGTVAEILVDLGQPIEVGEPILLLAEPGEDIDSSSTGQSAQDEAPGSEELADGDVPVANPAVETESAVSAAADGQQGSTGRVFASPLVRKIVRDKGIDLSGVTGSGPHGRIVRRDVEPLIDASGASPRPPTARDDVEASEPAAADKPTTSAPPIATAPPSDASNQFVAVPHTGMRRAIARRLTESKSTVPHFYLDADCRVDALLQLRRDLNALPGTSISVNDLIVKAAAGAFIDVPAANVMWTPEEMRRFELVHVAVAVAIEGGLVTPVLRDVARRSITDISISSRDLIERARAGRLQQHELEGGVFTISNLGMYGIQGFAAIINPPQAGILAVGAASRRPVVTDDQLAIATLMSVRLSGDHRAMDGATGAEWLRSFVTRIENPLQIVA